MIAAHQLRVEARGDLVTFTANGEELTTMTPHQAQSFAFWLARAYCRAGNIRRSPRGGGPTIRLKPGEAAAAVLDRSREARAC